MKRLFVIFSILALCFTCTVNEVQAQDDVYYVPTRSVETKIDADSCDTTFVNYLVQPEVNYLEKEIYVIQPAYYTSPYFTHYWYPASRWDYSDWGHYWSWYWGWNTYTSFDWYDYWSWSWSWNWNWSGYRPLHWNHHGWGHYHYGWHYGWYWNHNLHHDRPWFDYRYGKPGNTHMNPGHNSRPGNHMKPNENKRRGNGRWFRRGEGNNRQGTANHHEPRSTKPNVQRPSSTRTSTLPRTTHQQTRTSTGFQRQGISPSQMQPRTFQGSTANQRNPQMRTTTTSRSFQGNPGNQRSFQSGGRAVTPSRGGSQMGGRR